MENNYYLIIEKNERLGDYAFVDLNLLIKDDDLLIENTLESIDNFTKSFTYDKLISLIKESNIIHEEYLEYSTLKICTKDSKHRLDVITSDLLNDYNLPDFLKNNINDKNLMNTLYNKYKVLDEENYEEFKLALEKTEGTKVMSMINSLSYYKNRKLNIYILKKMLVKEKERKLKAA